ncbi:phosphoribosyltransferase [Actinoplanes sp. NPDC049265]|uniref:phosphoribosyltransferase n=1 Tax=Actinoplanes sp. NPDC049265 TaxID=3363902 RepID=UPI003713B0F8
MFRNRKAAGHALSQQLRHWHGGDGVVLGLPHGGVPVAWAVARALRLPLDVIVVRKIHPSNAPWVTLGAVGEGGVSFVNLGVVASCDVDLAALASAQRRAGAELDGCAGPLRRRWPETPLHGRTAIVVDDGMASGATARVACQVARNRGAARVVVAAPVAFQHAVATVRPLADEVVSLPQPVRRAAVGLYYHDFAPVTDAQVAGLLQRSPRLSRAGG